MIRNIYDPSTFLDSTCFSFDGSVSQDEDAYLIQASAACPQPLRFFLKPTPLLSAYPMSLPFRNPLDIRSSVILPTTTTMQAEVFAAVQGKPRRQPVPAPLTSDLALLTQQSVQTQPHGNQGSRTSRDNILLRLQLGTSPGATVPSTHLAPALAAEYQKNIVLATIGALDYVFPPSQLPIAIDDNLFHHLHISHFWSSAENKFIKSHDFTESSLASWLNALGLAMGTDKKKENKVPKRMWWSGTCSSPPSGSDPYVRKPDIALVDARLVTSNQLGAGMNWLQIQGFAEVTTDRQNRN